MRREVQRFKASLPSGYGADNPEDLVRSDTGGYVQYSAYEKLRAENERLRDENENFAARFYCGNCACNGCDRGRERRRQAEGDNDE